MHKITDENYFNEFNEKIFNLKENLSETFREIGTYISTASGEIKSFIEIMDPYIKYFFPLNESDLEESFIKEMVAPSQKEINEAIDQAVRAMMDDSVFHQSVAETIGLSTKLKECIDLILVLIEAIEIYSINSMIIAMKAGERGQSLATISMKMGDISREGNETGNSFISQMRELNNNRNEFNVLRDSIELLQETSLTGIKVKSSSNFSRLIEEINSEASEINSQYKMIRDVSAILDDVMNKYQFEDILRQGIEKIVYFIDEVLENRKLDELALVDFDVQYKIISWQLQNIQATLKKYFREIEDNLALLGNNINSFFSFFQKDTDGESQDILLQICQKLDEMKEEYSEYIENLLSRKRNLYNLTEKISGSIENFSSSFESIDSIARKFETIILMTKIELARYNDLNAALGNALRDVSVIPVKIRKQVDDIMPFYHELNASMKNAVASHYVHYREQEETLLRCVESIKKVSVYIHESHKYYSDFNDNSVKHARGVQKFLGDQEKKFSSFKNRFLFIDEFYSKFSQLSGDTENYESIDFKKYDEYISRLKSHFQITANNGDYKSMMLVSLLTEILASTAESERESIIFF